MADGRRQRAGRRDGPGGVGDGLPALPSGEPILPRWFVVPMLVLVPVGLVVAVWAFLSIGRESIEPAERRPLGTAEVTHDRGEAALNQTTTAEPGPRCAGGIEVLGDDGARAAGIRALSAACQLFGRGGYDTAEQGLDTWSASGGRLRFAVFERTGVDSSARVEDGTLVVELNAKFQFDDATLAAPFVIHELVHLGRGRWPGGAVTAEGELAATEAQARACEQLVTGEDPPRGCRDATELLAAADPLEVLHDAGYTTPSP